MANGSALEQLNEELFSPVGVSLVTVLLWHRTDRIVYLQILMGLQLIMCLITFCLKSLMANYIGSRNTKKRIQKAKCKEEHT